MHALAGDFVSAKATLIHATNHSREVGDGRSLVLALTERAKIALLRDGDITSAQTLLTDALAVATPLNDPALLSQVHRQWGNLGIITHNYPLAQAHLTQAVSIARRANNPLLLCLALSSLCHTLIEQSQYVPAQNIAQEVYAVAQIIDNRRMMLFGMTLQGVVNFRQGQIARALPHFQMAVDLCDDTSRLEDVASVQNYLAQCYFVSGDYKHAKITWGLALHTGLKGHILPEITRSLVGLAHLLPNHTDELTLLHLATNHPACHWEARQMATPRIAFLTDSLDEAVVADCMQRASSPDLLEQALLIMDTPEA
jgi:tetratricopeptide (TPR) repeat protein